MDIDMPVIQKKNFDISFPRGSSGTSRRVLLLLSALRLATGQRRWLAGDCYQMYLILRSVFPYARAYYDCNHVITKIDGKFYDITGEVDGSRHILLSREPRLLSAAVGWESEIHDHERRFDCGQ